MRNRSYELRKVNEVAERIPEADRVLRSNGIDPTSRLTLTQAAAVTGTSPDALLAVIEYKARRAARRHSVEEATPAARPPFFEEVEVEEDAALAF